MTGRVAVVTGGAGALGLSVTARFLAAGAVVAIPYVIPAEAERLRAATPPGQAARVLAEHVDVMDETALG